MIEDEHKSRTLITTIPGVVFRSRFDRGRTMEFLSDGCRRLTGYNKDELILNHELSYNDIIHPDDRDPTYQHIHTAVSEQKAFCVKYRILAKSGDIKWVREHGVGVFTDETDSLVLEGVIIDDTEQRRLEDELRSQKTFLRHIIDINPNFVFAKDRDGRFTLANQAVAEAYGTTVENLLGKTDADFNPNVDEVDSFRKADLEVMNTMHDKFIAEEKLTDSQGKVHWLQTVKRAIIGEKKQSLQVLGVATDITERKQIEADLENERASLVKRVIAQTTELKLANRELARTSRHKDEFLAMMSHELRTPLNAILGLTDILRQGIQGPLNMRQQRSVQMLEDSGRHLLDLINDILDLAKIEAGKIELNKSWISIKAVSDSSLQFVKQAATRKKIEISLDIDPAVNVVRADGRRLKQILVNLLSNAVKFTPENGQIGLEISGDVRAHRLNFTVWDTGIGIPSDAVDRLFQPFTQVDSSLTRKHEGTGLGLSLVYRLTEMHGGTVNVESDSGRGSRFSVTLPWDHKKDVSAVRTEWSTVQSSQWREKAGTAINFRGQTIRILLAEDNEDNIEVMREYLQFNKYEVTVARTGTEVLARAAESPPHLILMDIHLPELDGLEAIRRLRTNQKFTEIPIIALTALAMPGDRETCLEAGADAYLSKPIKLQKLVEMIEERLLSKSDQLKA